jgi:hypothetical protein
VAGSSKVVQLLSHFLSLRQARHYHQEHFSPPARRVAIKICAMQICSLESSSTVVSERKAKFLDKSNFQEDVAVMQKLITVSSSVSDNFAVTGNRVAFIVVVVVAGPIT